MGLAAARAGDLVLQDGSKAPLLCAAAAAVLLISGTAAAQPARRAPAPSPAPVVAASPVPQQTTATFGDWIMRCNRPAGAAKSCEVVQQVQQDGKPVAQTAIGAAAKGKPMQLMVLVPPSVSFAQRPALMPPTGDAEVAALTWLRCLPSGCVAETEAGEAVLQQLRGWTQPARIAFADAAGRAVALPFSPLGLAQALDALAKEDVD